MSFRGDVALVTGAASGIGQLAAWRLAAEGTRVAAVDVDVEGLERTGRRAETVSAWQCDVSRWEEVQRVVAEVEEMLGPIDRVVNAAGIAASGPLLETDVEVIRRVMEVNYLGTVHVTRATLPPMIDRGSGDLVNISSLAGWLPSPGFGAYSATKFAVVAFTETLAYENLGRGVRILCVCPPTVETPMLEQVDPETRKLLSALPPIRPEVVLDSIEDALEGGQLFAFPGPRTRAAWVARRLAPRMLWRRITQVQEAGIRRHDASS